MSRSFVNDQKLQRRGSSVSSPLREGQELRGDLTPSPGQDASWLLLGEVVLARPFRRRLNQMAWRHFGIHLLELWKRLGTGASGPLRLLAPMSELSQKL